MGLVVGFDVGRSGQIFMVFSLLDGPDTEADDGEEEGSIDLEGSGELEGFSDGLMDKDGINE